MQHILAVEFKKVKLLKNFPNDLLGFLRFWNHFPFLFNFSSKIYYIVNMFLVIDNNLESEMFEKF